MKDEMDSKHGFFCTSSTIDCPSDVSSENGKELPKVTALYNFDCDELHVEGSKVFYETLPFKTTKCDQAKVFSLDSLSNETDPDEIQEPTLEIPENDQILNESYINIVVKTGNGEQLIRVKSLEDLKSFPHNLSSLFPDQTNGIYFQRETVANKLQVSNHELDNSNELEETHSENMTRIQSNGVVESPNVMTLKDFKGQTRVFACPIPECGLSFRKETKLRVHLMTHQETRQFKCTHDGCDWCFTSAYRLKRHLSCHSEQKNFLCDEPGCDRKFTTIYNLNTHKSLHKRPSSIECLHPHCEQKFPTRREMDFHYKNHTDCEPPYLCPIATCEKKFFSSTFLSSHLRAHQFSEDDLTCPIPDCKKRYKRICQLRVHMRGHNNERPFACTYEGCCWTFVTASRLTRHMRKHTNERNYICPVCEKKFMRPEHLKGHVIIHNSTTTGDSKPFKCPIENCQAAFTAKSSVYVHLKKHNDTLGYYQCPIDLCLRKYRSKTSLKKHLANCHQVLDDMPNLTLNTIVEVSKSKNPDPEEVENLQESPSMPCVGAETILPDDNGANCQSMMEVDAQESSLILSQELSQEILPTEESNVDFINRHLNSIIEEAAMSALTNPSTIEQVVSQATMENGSRSGSPDYACRPSPSPDIDSLNLPLPEIRKGGSARTDFCSNTILSTRARKRRILRQQFENQKPESNTKDQLLPTVMLSSTSDVFLASSAISFDDQCGENSQLLEDDASEMYSENILDNIATELGPLHALSETCGATSNVFPVTEMNINDL